MSRDGRMVAIDAPVAPLYIGPGNCELLIGHKPRWTKRTAIKLGVAVLTVPGSRKWLIPASLFAAALEREGVSTSAPTAAAIEEGSEDELAAMRERLSMRRAGEAR